MSNIFSTGIFGNRYLFSETNKIIKREINKLVVFGASIMQLSFEGDGQQLTSDKFYDKGLAVEVFERANSGDDVSEMLGKIDGIIAEFQEFAGNTVFMIHGPGNSLSSYPNNAAEIDTKMRLIAQKVKDAGFMLAMTTITYREVPPYPHDSQPYNENVINAIIDEFADIKLDMYTRVYETRDVWFGPKDGANYDGVHPRDEVGKEINRTYIVDEVSKKIINVLTPENEQFNDIVIQFGDKDIMIGGLNKAVNGSQVELYNTDYSRVKNGFISFDNVDLKNNGGRGNTLDQANDTISVYNNAGLEDFCYTPNNPMVVNFANAGIDLSANYLVKITASRAVSDNGDRTGVYTIGESSKQLNAASTPPEVIEMTVSGLELKAKKLVVEKADLSQYAYLSIAQVTKIK